MRGWAGIGVLFWLNVALATATAPSSSRSSAIRQLATTAVATTTAAAADHNRKFTLDDCLHAAIVLAIGVSIIVLNLIVLCCHYNMPEEGEVVNVYLVSVCSADLVCGILVVPLSVYPSLIHEWPHGEFLCRVAGYTEAVTWVINIYTLMWISVDRYLAIRKPVRYETVQTRTRCQCWMAFTWLAAAALGIPPLLGEGSTPVFDSQAFVCSLNYNGMIAYAYTIIVLVVGPSLATILFNYGYLAILLRRMKKGHLQISRDKEYLTALTESLANPHHTLAILLVLCFWVLWSPFVCLRLYEQITGYRVNNQRLQFAVVWIGFSQCAWKAFVLMIYSPQFSVMFRYLCVTVTCGKDKYKRVNAMEMGQL